MVALIPTVLAVSAGLSALIGIVVLESFFRNKIQDLFDDSNYFVFFFLVLGYVLYSLGELSYYLGNIVFVNRSAAGIENFYWLVGGVVILVSFCLLSLLQAKKNRQGHKFFILLVIGVVLAVISFLIVQSEGNNLFNFFFPIISSLIVAFSLSSIFFSRSLGIVAKPLQLFFLASSLILVGDILFSLPSLIAVSDYFYIFGYGLSSVAFIVFRSRVHSLGYYG